MKTYTRDRITSVLGIILMSVLVVSSYYYAVRTEVTLTKTVADKDSPDFITHNIVITTFNEDGTAKNRLFADYAEHFSDGRTKSIKPRIVTLELDKPQMKTSADSAVTLDDGETVTLTGNVLLTRAGDNTHAPLQITTTEATVYPDTGIVKTTEHVQIQNGTDSHSGDGMHFDNVDRKLELFSNVHTVVMPKTFMRKQ